MNILITGANGFIATYIRETIGYKFKGYNILYATTTECKSDNFIKFASLYDDISNKLNNIDIYCIVHCASIIPKTFNEADYSLFLKNTEMMKNIYEFSITKKVKKLIYLSSFGSMKNPKQLDLTDYYTMSKVVGELFCSMLTNKGINAVSLRISAPYGEYSRHKNVINIFVEKALKGEDITLWGSGQRKQNFTYVGDVLNAILLIIEKEVHGTYEIVGSKSISMFKLAKLIIKLTNSKSRVIFTDKIDPQEDYRPKYSYIKAYKAFGYRPKYTLIDGLIRYIEWYKKNNSF